MSNTADKTLARDPRNHAIKYGRADEIIFDRIDEEFAALARTRRDALENSKASEERVNATLFDAFNALARIKPNTNADADPFAANVFKAIEGSTDYHQLRHYTTGDDAAAALGANSLTNAIVDAISDEVAEAANELDNANAEADELESKAQEAEAKLEEAGDDATDEDITSAEAMRQLADEAADAADEAHGALAQQISQEAATIKAAVSDAVSDAAKQVAGLDAIGNMAGTETTMTGKSNLPLEAKLDIANRLAKGNEKFNRFVDMLGNMVSIAESKRKHVSDHEAGELVDLATGGDLELLIDEEIALMRNPTFAKLQLAKLVDEDLSQFRVEARDTEGKGDAVVLLDESGSMGGDRDLESKAIAGAVVHAMAKQGRNVIVHTFQYNITATFRFLRTDSPATLARNLVSLVERGVAGGTSFDPCFNQAISDIEANGTVDDADVLVITDGDASMSKETIERAESLKTRKGVNIYATIIGSASAGGLKSVADKVWKVDSAATSADGLFTELVKK